MSNYEMKVGNRIKEMRYVTINNISMVENIDYIILDDRRTIRFISDKAKEVCDLFSNQDIINEDYKKVDYKSTYHTLYSNISKLLIENRQNNWSSDILLKKWDNIRMHVSYIGDK